MGKTVPLVSKYTLNATVQYTKPVAIKADGFVRIDFFRKGTLYWYPDNKYSQDPYNVVNAKLGMKFRQWTFDFYGRNIFNQKYNVLFFDNTFVGAPGGFNFGYPAPPAVYGIEGSYRF